jgi:L-cysteine S-thiosulfotransferase
MSRSEDHRQTRRSHALGALLAALTAAPMAHARDAALHVVADGIPDPVATSAGNAERGRALLVKRDTANCVLCHAVPDPAIRFSGNVGPTLAGVGTRLSVPQLRLRIADIRRVNPSAVMPSYFNATGQADVAQQYRGQTILTATEVEDVVAYLATLQ